MKTVVFFSLFIILSLLNSSCKNDHDEYGQLKGINYISRNDAFSLEQLSFENAVGILNDTLNRLGLITIAPNTFSNEDGSPFSGKVVMSIREDFVRGFMALNSVPSVSVDGKPLFVVGAIYIGAVDNQGHKLKIETNKNIDISIPGSAVASQNKMYYGEDFVVDPSPANTALFNWKESTSDTLPYYFNSNLSKYFYKLKPTHLGWISCAQPITNSISVGIKIRVSGFFPGSALNTAVYVLPKNGKSAFRLWNYDNQSHKFSLDQPYLEKGSEVYIIAIATARHFKTYFAKELITVGDNTDETVTANEVSLGSVINDLYFL